jgi:hypothetical protein
MRTAHEMPAWPNNSPTRCGKNLVVALLGSRVAGELLAMMSSHPAIAEPACRNTPAAWISTSLQASDVFSATQHIGGRSRATPARSHPNTPARGHILAAKPRALRNSGVPMELRRQEPAPRRLAALYKPGLHRPAVPCTPLGTPALRTHRQVPPNQRPDLRSRSPESYKLGRCAGR